MGLSTVGSIGVLVIWDVPALAKDSPAQGGAAAAGLSALSVAASHSAASASLNNALLMCERLLGGTGEVSSERCD
tara:strand:+ start:60 stop:284 length:225 start_codon:yes stop_codon:yes gene_type:complete